MSKSIIFRSLRPEEILVRIDRVFENQVSLLLYKDARVDEDLLDEIVGPYNWKRTHREVVLGDGSYCQACTISIYDDEKNEWIEKEDFGSENFTFETAKAMASDSFKRAGFAWGIGRELYTAPNIWVNDKNCTIVNNGDGTFACYDEFVVTQVSYDSTGHKITALTIKNKTIGRTVINYDIRTDAEKLESQIRAAEARLEEEKNRSILFSKAKDLGIDVTQYTGVSDTTTLPAKENVIKPIHVNASISNADAESNVEEQRKELERMSPRGLSKIFLTAPQGSREASLCLEIAKAKDDTFYATFNAYVENGGKKG